MRAHALSETAHGQRVELGHGDIIGRIHSAPLRPARQRGARHGFAAGLRGVFEFKARRSKSLALGAGQRVAFAPDLFVHLRAVRQPTHVMALDIPALGRGCLAGTYSLHSTPRLRVDLDLATKVEAWV